MMELPGTCAGDSMVTCPRCQGAGRVMVAVLYPAGRYSLYEQSCLPCGGQGTVEEKYVERLRLEKAELMLALDASAHGRLRQIRLIDRRIKRGAPLEVVVVTAPAPPLPEVGA